jgi:molecular chaperone GrpE
MSEAETKPEEESAENSTATSAQQESLAESEQTQFDSDVDNAPSIEEQLKAAVAERDTHYHSWMHTRADLENYRKRAQREAEEIRRYHTTSLIRDLLPGLDNLQRAIQAAENSSNIEELLQGVRMVAEQFESVLSSHALKPIEAAGKPFDPNKHEAVQQVPSSEHPPMTVIEEIERGFTLHDRVVRPSKVIVSSGPSE